ncbi:hypothetical protein C8J30_12110 [Rhodobacter viridis]|uniref:Uncharacterized protein n=2 Tax=Rhodobacter viridis TaxID=1054202 RepID=A0A318TQ55_9RHOB|nr:hypothetical protein C8J30_12110 [Rhodobacter viridis]
MLTPLPSPVTPSPLPAGVHSLSLPQGAQLQRHMQNALAELPQGAPRPDAAAQPQTTQPQGAGSLPLPGATPERGAAEALAKAATLTAEALAGTATPSSQGSAATPMSLVAAQMLGVDTTALQSVLAQQAATRALPGAHRRAEPHHDDPPAPLLSAPDDGFDPHAPHPPPVLPHPHGARPPPESEIPETTAAPKDRKRARESGTDPPHRHDLPVPTPFADLTRRPTLWTIAGAIFTAVFVVTLLLI